MVQQQVVSEKVVDEASGSGAAPPVGTRPGVQVLAARDALHFLRSAPDAATAILDPWYNRGVGGTVPEEEYHASLRKLVAAASKHVDHVFVWGFPEVVAKCLDYIPGGFGLEAWLTWYYGNCPTRVRGWRSSQQACLHLRRNGAQMYVEHFLNERQLECFTKGTLAAIPGPTTVLHHALPIGFVGAKEKTGHPAQKPTAVFEPLVKMTTKPGDLVLDPMAGSGTTGVVAQRLGRQAVLCDQNASYVRMMEKRLGLTARSVLAGS